MWVVALEIASCGSALAYCCLRFGKKCGNSLTQNSFGLLQDCFDLNENEFDQADSRFNSYVFL